VGMFRDMKDMMQTVRSDELKELKKKADAQPKRSMLEGVKMANAAYDDAVAMQAGSAAMAGTAGTAIVNAIRDTGTLINMAPVCELDLTVTVPGKEPYAVKHRQLIAHSALARYQPGATFSVRVDTGDPSKLVIG
jgi:hypothetical protein